MTESVNPAPGTPKRKPAKGRLSKAEEQYLLFNAPKMTAEELAEKVGRGVDFVRKFLSKNFDPAKLETAEDREVTIKTVIKEDLRESPEWKRLKKEFAPDELKDFEHSYVELAAQFRDDLLASERLQLMEVIKIGILISRNLQSRRRDEEDIIRLENQVRDSASNLDLGCLDSKRAHNDLEKTLVSLKVAQGSKTGEYEKLLQRQDALMKTLKATRDQRVKEIESGKTTFLGLVKQLQNEEIREKEGREMALMNLAAEKEYERLGKPYKFADGVLDQPILSADTLKMNKEEDE